MKRRLLIALVTAGIGTGAAVTAGALLHDEAKADRKELAQRILGLQPDTTSPNWKLLAADVGVLIRDEGRLGLRGRLYVRVDGVWLPVATDEIVPSEAIPAR